MNRKHNRSSSPFTTLADRAERKVVSTGAGQPNYWPKTWFGADAYKAKLVTPKCAIKLFGLVGNSFVPISSPWQFVPRCVHETTEEAKFNSLEKVNTEYGLCSLESDWYGKHNLTDYNAPTRAIWHAGGQRLREKALYRLEIKSAVYKRLFGPHVARLRRLASAKGLLNGNSLWVSIRSQTLKESGRWPALESPVVKDNKYLEKKKRLWECL